MGRFAVFLLALLCVTSCKPEAATPSTAAPIEGKVWVGEDIDGKGIIDNSRLTIEFSADGKVSGHSGCNRYMGSFERTGDRLTFPTAMASTRMACMAEAINNQEQAYLDVLSKVDRYAMTADGALVLKTPEGSALTFREGDAKAE